MQMAPFIEALQNDLRELAALGDEQVAQAVDRLATAMGRSAGLRLLDALTQAALELSDQLPNGNVDVRVAGRDPEFVFVPSEPAETYTAPLVAEDEQARITLRLPESLKASIESAAAAEGVSVNNWLVRALTRAVQSGSSWGPARTGKRITGWSQA
jgi:HicB family